MPYYAAVDVLTNRPLVLLSTFGTMTTSWRSREDALAMTSRSAGSAAVRRTIARAGRRSAAVAGARAPATPATCPQRGESRPEPTAPPSVPLKGRVHWQSRPTWRSPLELRSPR